MSHLGKNVDVCQIVYDIYYLDLISMNLVDVESDEPEIYEVDGHKFYELCNVQIKRITEVLTVKCTTMVDVK